jgi:isoleucyl-tRNA synthetase
MSDSVEQTKRTDFKDTLNLPKTEFPIRPNAKIDDPLLLERWAREGLYTKAMQCNEGKATYILHDGPPYANGNIHLGHAYNKILKDIITKAYRMSGYHVPITPGWDCHGLPIELKVTQETPGMNPLQIKQACRAYAQKWIDVQRSEFKRLGIIMDWEHPYVTMDFSYEAMIMRAFGRFVHEGFIERKKKTVAWCPSCQTTLASAEIEYEDRKDPSIYVLFQLAHIPDPRIAAVSGGAPVHLVVWTTTPWTLPLNRALALKPHSTYQLLRIQDKLVIVGEKLAGTLMALVPGDHEMVATIPAESLAGLEARHPFIPSLTVPIILDDLVSVEDGTAIVHKAPGCGPEDYEFGVKHGLEIYSPITADGKYTDEIVPAELAGISVADGQGLVIKKLLETGTLFHKASITHSYPHCWRCHNGLIFRATQQWFFDLQREGIKEKALAAVETIAFIPEAGRNFLRATLAHRWEWCLSRQKVWGVPIPALICASCDYAFTNKELVEKVAEQVATQGIEYWETVPLADVMPAGLSCPKCKGSEFRKEQDILDVWFDSGLSHFAVLEPRKQFPADLYLEGIDQFRGWFQSSLLTSLVLEGTPAVRTIATHGFTVDEQGRKMSKSLGNVMPPQQLIDRLGTDGIRLWAASLGLEGDAVVSERVIQNVGEVFRKVRNTCRFLLQNLSDFSMERDALPASELRYLDALALLQCAEFNEKMRKAYLKADLTEVFHGLADYCTTQLSSLYLDCAKDRLYVEGTNGKARRSAQTVIWYMLDTLTRLMAPICSCTAEQLADFYQGEHQSIHLQSFADLSAVAEEVRTLLPHDEQQWETIVLLRDAILKELERVREQGSIKHSLEAHVVIYFMTECPQCSTLAALKQQLERRGESIESFLQELCIVSKIQFAENSDGLTQTALAGVFARVEHAQGTKCPRCWQWHETKHGDGLCDRCASIVGA